MQGKGTNKTRKYKRDNLHFLYEDGKIEMFPCYQCWVYYFKEDIDAFSICKYHYITEKRRKLECKRQRVKGAGTLAWDEIDETDYNSLNRTQLLIYSAERSFGNDIYDSGSPPKAKQPRRLIMPSGRRSNF